MILAVLTPTIAWTLSQASPAWANRYLAVALPPFLLLAAGGLAGARRLGAVGLVLVVIMWAQDAAPVEKSNVRAIAHAIGPSLAPGDLVISTQPESIPVLHYYLPDGPALRDADRRADRARRVGLARRRRAPGGDLAPRGTSSRSSTRSPGGSRVVLVEPITWTLNRWRAPWTALVRIRSKEWAQYLSNDPRLEVAAVQPAELHAAAAESGAGDGDGEDGLAGSVSTKQAPRSKESASSSVPPMRSASSRPIASPRPKPLSALVALPRWKRSKTCSCSSSGTPGPWSATWTVTVEPSCAATIWIGSPRGA